MTAPSSLGKKKGKIGGGGKKPTRGGDVGLCNTLTGTHSLARSPSRSPPPPRSPLALLRDPTPVSARFSYTAPTQTWMEIHLTSPLCFALTRMARCRIAHQPLFNAPHNGPRRFALRPRIVARGQLGADFTLISLNYALPHPFVIILWI